MLLCCPFSVVLTYGWHTEPRGLGIKAPQSLLSLDSKRHRMFYYCSTTEQYPYLATGAAVLVARAIGVSVELWAGKGTGTSSLPTYVALQAIDWCLIIRKKVSLPNNSTCWRILPKHSPPGQARGNRLVCSSVYKNAAFLIYLCFSFPVSC